MQYKSYKIRLEPNNVGGQLKMTTTFKKQLNGNGRSNRVRKAI